MKMNFALCIFSVGWVMTEKEKEKEMLRGRLRGKELAV